MTNCNLDVFFNFDLACTVRTSKLNSCLIFSHFSTKKIDQWKPIPVVIRTYFFRRSHRLYST